MKITDIPITKLHPFEGHPYTVTGYFTYGQYNLGSTYADGFVTGSNFDPAGVWIK